MGSGGILKTGSEGTTQFITSCTFNVHIQGKKCKGKNSFALKEPVAMSDCVYFKTARGDGSDEEMLGM